MHPPVIVLLPPPRDVEQCVFDSSNLARVRGPRGGWLSIWPDTSLGARRHGTMRYFASLGSLHLFEFVV